MEKTEKAVNKKKKSRLGFMVFIIVAFALCLTVNYILSYNSRMETMIVRSGADEDVIEAKGYVFRKQTVVYASDGGYMYCNADDEQRVKSGEAVVYVYKNEINAQANKEIEEIDKEIARLSDDKTGDLTENDVAKIEQSISDVVCEVPLVGYERDFEKLSEIRMEVDSLIDDKRVAGGEITPEESTQSLESLQKRKGELLKQYDVERTAVYAPVAGVFTSRVDGLEDMLSTDALTNVSAAYLEKIEKKEAENPVVAKVEKGSAVGKIVDNFAWNVAAVVPTKEIEDVSVGDGVQLRFTDISVETVDGTVLRIINEGDSSVLVVRSKEYLESVYSTSRADVQIIKHKYEGFRVPSESIRMVDGKTGVYILKNNKSRFVPIDILYNNKEWAIVSEQITDGGSTLKLYDELIVSGRNLYDGKVVQ